MKTDRQKSFVSLHIAILFFGLTAVLGDLISLDAIPLVWWRLVLAVIAFVPVLMIRKTFNWSSFLSYWKPILLVSVFLSVHWITFFMAVKLANASIAVLCIATSSFMTAMIEPLVTKRPFRSVELVFGLMIIPGMFLVVSSVDPSMYWGIVSGLISAFLASLFTTYNKSIVGKGSTMFFTFMELLLAVVVLSIIMLAIGAFDQQVKLWPVPVADWKYLIFLAVICTTLSYTLAFDALKHMTAFTANLSVNLEPVYGIILAALILNEYEDLNVYFYVGTVLILLVVIIFPIFEKQILRRKINKKHARIF